MVMGERKNQNFKDHHHHHHHHHDHHKSWTVKGLIHEHQHERQHPCSSNEEASTISNGSSSSSSSTSLTCSSSSFELMDDASSSSANSSRSSLYDLSDLMSHLPIKRGLSKFYHGKSDSFTSLARVTSIEDLPKKENNPYKRMKKSYKSHTLPKPIISKKNSRKKKFGSCIKKEYNE
ncbi:uncharacterized protein [Rutidosis leptorrhynchoides]|uniref:uncharacterized protein n=1 Tax=Rutidosis leptorrhynchoides TaxID=125765 RepID=UPI003A98E8A4